MNATIKTASVRVMLSHNYSNFEVSMNIENENGIEVTDIDEARKQCQSLATAAVAEYKALPGLNPKVELQRVENKLAEIKKLVTAKEPEPVDPKEVAKIESLPLYQGKKAEAKKPAKKAKS